jgi:hypothetical protein
MAYLSNLQEAVQSTTQAVFSSSFEHAQKNYEEENTRSSTSVTSQDSLLAHSWPMNYALKHSFPKSDALETEAKSTVIPSLALVYDASGIDQVWQTWSSLTLTFQSSLEKWRSISTFGNLESKAWEIGYSLALNLQDLFVARQIWEERNALVHDLSHTETRKNRQDLIVFLHDNLEVKGALEKHDNLTLASSVIESQPLEQLYAFRKPTETLHFLEANPFLVPLLQEAYANIRKYFPYSELFLEVITDPEAIDEKQLVVFIAVEQNPDEASQALDQLDENWWLDAMERVQDKLCITLEFR